jgi:hypothetical protein
VLTVVAVPAEQRLLPDGADTSVSPFALPHAPQTGAGWNGAEQLTVEPPFTP